MKNDDLTALRRDFHRTPELGFAENLTKARIAAILTELGLLSGFLQTQAQECGESRAGAL